MRFFNIHSHTEYSNFRLLDSTNKVEDILDKALEMGLPGLAITDHETVSSHMRAYQHVERNKERFGDFKLAYGNEIYLIDEEDSIRARENNERIRYYHFILVAKNENGYKGIRELSSAAWGNAYFHRGMQRVPLFKHQLEEIMKKYKGDIIASTACLGGELPQLLLGTYNEQEDLINIEEYLREGELEKVDFNINRILGRDKVRDNAANVEKIREKLSYNDEELMMYHDELECFLYEMTDIFEDDFYIELQPGDRDIQRVANNLLYRTATNYKIKPIITTDSHYLDLTKQSLHESYLNAKSGDREIAEFYSTTYLMDDKHLEKFIDKELLNELLDNTVEIMNKIEHINFGNKTQIPKAHIPESFNKDYIQFFQSYPQYKHIQKLLASSNEQNQYYLHLIYEGYKEKYDKINKNWSVQQILNRIDLEMEQINELSDYFEQEMSGYFLFVKELVDVIWEVSFVAPNRGSAACWITNYLLDITQFNPMDYDLPYWRFLHIARGRELPDMKMSVLHSLYNRGVHTLTKNKYVLTGKGEYYSIPNPVGA